MAWLKPAFPERPEDAKKGDYGRVVAVGGSRDLPNTPAIVATAASRAGADLPFINAPERPADACSSFALDLITRPLEGERLLPGHVDRIRQSIDDSTVLVIGNGVGRSQASVQAVQQLVAETDVPVVLDADALHADVAGMRLADRKAVLTPHRGEFKALYEEPGESLAVRKEQVAKAARVVDATIVLKAPRDVVSDGEDTVVNETGNPYMTKGGTGDVLAGITAALLARYRPLEAGFLAAQVAGIAGDRAADELRQSLMLDDVLEEIPPAFEEARERAS
ncbi:MAG: NAD(P)H-hydrate dehydratase [Candidatus Nanohaloarchaea archaeon]|nr:NAD(P)H-hydrate dehydratase [Candidatus Nanohaloarchaea archaeon]